MLLADAQVAPGSAFMWLVSEFAQIACSVTPSSCSASADLASSVLAKGYPEDLQDVDRCHWAMLNADVVLPAGTSIGKSPPSGLHMPSA